MQAPRNIRHTVASTDSIACVFIVKSIYIDVSVEGQKPVPPLARQRTTGDRGERALPGRHRQEKHRQPRGGSMEPWAALRGDGTFSLQVVGVASCQRELREICGGDLEGGQEQRAVALLIPEETNPYSAEAVRVQV